MKLAAFSGVFLEHSLQEAMRLTQYLGFDGIEIACREPHLSMKTTLAQIKEIRNLALYELGLEMPVLAGYMGNFSTASDRECEEAFAELQQMLEWAAVLGAESVRVAPGGPNAFLAEDYHYAKAAHWISRCAREAERYHKRLLLEIHHASLSETVESGLRLLGQIPERNVGLIHDAGNMYITGTGYGRDSVLQIGDRLFHVHVKDEKRIPHAGGPGTFTSRTAQGEEAFAHCRFGEGETDHRALFGALAETGYPGWITLESWAPDAAFVRMDFDIKGVKKMLLQAKRDRDA